MKKQSWLLNILLAVSVFLYCAGVFTARLFSPLADVPALSPVMMAVLVLVPLVIDAYAARGNVKRVWPAVIGLAAAAFAVLPAAAGLVPWTEAVPTGLLGALITFVLTLLLDGITKRTVSGKGKPGLAPVVNAFVLFLAAQVLNGMM